jgi:c-di-GMP-binding flagellar brake protein YcgR
MFLDTQPAPLDDDDGGDPWIEFRVSGQGEIYAHLKPLLDSSLPFNISAEGGSVITTCLWSIDTARNTMSFAGDVQPEALQAILQAGRATAVAYNESVKYQLALTGLTLVEGAQASALQCSIPEAIYRFQRRNFYRARTPTRGGPSVRLRHPANPSLVLALKVLDVSIGGCGLQLPLDAPPMPEGTKATGVRVDLDPDTRLLLGFVVRRASDMVDAEGEPCGTRLGCEWTNLNGQSERALQLYVDNLQKRRRMLAMR